MTTSGYVPRIVDGLVTELVGELPAVLIVGPRATGKTTTARRLAASVVRLDLPAQAVAMRADPDAVLRGFDEPVLIDEWQEAPEVLGAVKRAVDSDPHPGRFILTGSVRGDLDAHTWPGTGRITRVTMGGLSVRETHGDPRARAFLDRLADPGGVAGSPTLDDPVDLRGYVELALVGGFPEAALWLPDRARTFWLESYLDQLLTRDVETIDGPRDPLRLRRFFEAVALNTAGITELGTLYEAAGIGRSTASGYLGLLRNLLVVDELPAWASNRLKRLTRKPKRYLSDAALVGAALGLDSNAVLLDGNLLGRLLETFVLAQLKAELPTCTTRPRLHHLREEHGRYEVDVVVEYGTSRVFGIEVKADSAPRSGATKHLHRLRDALGDRFAGGVVLHTGAHTYPLGHDITAAPISTIWA